ncbi:nitrous oxide-stimulated promoter family protein [Wolinella succinogenes]|uniref:nitrous oxide-stimulated promoter family protein n=1 Tax=Wolinella succinogenes TaxID=844 RepID=UPI002408FEB5|nr:nitrous oxide-stimulated promoter family protein [Wolinella succinogenes]
MTQEKFLKDIHLLADFTRCYCEGNHAHASKESLSLDLSYKGENLQERLELLLCQECKELFLYAHDRLQACPHEEKPRCRQCPHPCYEREWWKRMAKMMRYSGIRLGFSKLKEKIAQKFR